MNLYCILVVTGKEISFRDSAIKKMNSGEIGAKGKFHVIKKLMRLKNGKIYSETLFPGYVFFETEIEDKEILAQLKSADGYLRFLPSMSKAAVLKGNDLDIVRGLISDGDALRFLRVRFDENDKVVIKNKLYRNCKGVVKSVNRCNHRLNLEVELLNGIRVINLSYFDIEKEDWSQDEENFLKTSAVNAE